VARGPVAVGPQRRRSSTIVAEAPRRTRAAASC